MFQSRPLFQSLAVTKPVVTQTTNGGTKWKFWTISFHRDPMVYCTSNSLAVTACQTWAFFEKIKIGWKFTISDKVLDTFFKTLKLKGGSRYSHETNAVPSYTSFCYIQAAIRLQQNFRLFELSEVKPLMLKNFVFIQKCDVDGMTQNNLNFYVVKAALWYLYSLRSYSKLKTGLLWGHFFLVFERFRPVLPCSSTKIKPDPSGSEQLVPLVELTLNLSSVNSCGYIERSYFIEQLFS